MHPILIAATVLAGTPPIPAPIEPPKVFRDAGYSEPDIGAAACRTVNASETQCAVPPMTAGVYLVRASATSTANAADAAQQLTIVAGSQSCTSTRTPDPKTPWAVGAKRTFYSACVFTLVTDAPMAITAVYIDAKATKDASGPQVSVSREAWGGALNSLPVSVPQKP